MNHHPDKKHQFPELDTIRGFAFLLVVLSHIGNVRSLPTRGLGQFGVWIFFVLSAFLLSHPFFVEPARAWQLKEWCIYLKRRTLRILPPLLLALIAYRFTLHFTWTEGLLNMLFVRGDGLLWTVFVETRYYVLLPFIVTSVLVMKSKPRVLLAVLVAALALHLIDAPFWRNVPYWGASSASTSWQEREHLFVLYLPLFIAGTLLAGLRVAVEATTTWNALLVRFAPICTVAALVLLVLLSPAALSLILDTRLPAYYYFRWWTPMLPLPCALVFFPTFLRGRFEQVIANPAFRFIGKISYSGYLSHVIFVQRFANIIHDNTLYAVSVIGATFTVSTLSHFFVERPFIAFSHRP